MEHNIGDTVTLKSFCYINKFGGTGLSNSSVEDVCYTKPVKAEIIKTWDDIETGERYWLSPDKNDKEFQAFLDKVAMKAIPDMNNLEDPYIPVDFYLILAGEFDLI